MSDLDDFLRAHPLTLRALTVTGLSYEALSTSTIEVGDPDYPEAWVVNLPKQANPRHICDIKAFAILVWYMTEMDADERLRDIVNRFITSEERGLHVSDSVAVKRGRSKGGYNFAEIQKNAKKHRVAKVLELRDKYIAQGRSESSLAGLIYTDLRKMPDEYDEVTKKLVMKWSVSRQRIKIYLNDSEK